ncbi:hypothetical protein Plhal304r1_c015g0056331 [Plasmopara halstedii]
MTRSYRSSSFSDEHLHAMRFLLPALEFVPGTYIAGRIVDGIVLTPFALCTLHRESTGLLLK